MIKLQKALITTLLPITLLSLSACGTGKSKNNSLEKNDSSKQASLTHKKAHHKDHKKKTQTKKVAATNAIDENKSNQSSTQSSQNKETLNSGVKPQSSGTTSNANSVHQNGNASNPEHAVSTPEDAMSLYSHYLGLSGNPSDGYTATPVDGGFVVTPKESAYGHAQTIIKYDGSAYNTNGKLIASASQMMAPNNPNTPESGWHGA